MVIEDAEPFQEESISNLNTEWEERKENVVKDDEFVTIESPVTVEVGDHTRDGYTSVIHTHSDDHDSAVGVVRDCSVKVTRLKKNVINQIVGQDKKKDFSAGLRIDEDVLMGLTRKDDVLVRLRRDEDVSVVSMRKEGVSMDLKRKEKVSVGPRRKENSSLSENKQKISNGKMKDEKVLVCHKREEDVSVPWYEWRHHECVVCSSAVYLGSMDRHLQLHHKLTLVDYKEHYKVPEMALFIPSYECLICGLSVIHTHKKILSHLQLHNIDMGSYYFQYINVKRVVEKTDQKEKLQTNQAKENESKLDSASPSKPESSSLSKSLIQKQNKNPKSLLSFSASRNINASSTDCSQKSSTVIPKAKRSRQALASPKSSISTPAVSTKKRRRSSTEPAEELPWYDSSWHQCLECDKVTTRGRFFTIHVKEHKMTKKQYLEKYPAEKNENVPDWTCGICSKKISWAAKSIVTHLGRVHSMTKEQYANVFIKNMEEEGGQDLSEEIMLEGEPQIHRLDTTQDITEALGIIGVDV